MRTDFAPGSSRPIAVQFPTESQPWAQHHAASIERRAFIFHRIIFRIPSEICFFFSYIYFPASGQAVVTGVVPSSPWLLPSIFIAHRVQQSHCSSIFHRGLLTHALALSASQIVHEKKSPRIYTSMHSGGFELTKLIYTRLEDNLIRHRGDRQYTYPERISLFYTQQTQLPRLGKTRLSRSMHPYLLCLRLKQTYPTMSASVD